MDPARQRAWLEQIKKEGSERMKWSMRDGEALQRERVSKAKNHWMLNIAGPADALGHSADIPKDPHRYVPMYPREIRQMVFAPKSRREDIDKLKNHIAKLDAENESLTKVTSRLHTGRTSRPPSRAAVSHSILGKADPVSSRLRIPKAPSTRRVSTSSNLIKRKSAIAKNPQAHSSSKGYPALTRLSSMRSRPVSRSQPSQLRVDSLVQPNTRLRPIVKFSNLPRKDYLSKRTFPVNGKINPRKNIKINLKHLKQAYEANPSAFRLRLTKKKSSWSKLKEIVSVT
uniref:Uncharacterized protein n=1 Tax=Norrisiella sphaerica TaxID=552664 RepID=A0A7S2QSZ3_9EUKA|mmetsp:Transcript_2323/g.3334  ORF Transcript_2323/g.3334 Transcript_2323/m.3334 type:complete len:285 (+) Transcript_2323:211-1065(+)|eukprot:CAMPEP_0184483486 /NCGR_PEP_ID=MMETSP0113_2-20130426/5143_1 /TAXON_ID=91329 /ORGANISM="Norrisiella sphaerica, Strain BC52" /LENGTH=284 /DNA_ID=CAMNT_0026863925 /DNA_START=202 /DNA_END=1056 /DNA_ORIENTATION=-